MAETTGKEISKKRIFINAAIIVLVVALTFFYLLRNNFLTKENLSKLTAYAFVVCFAVFVATELVLAVVERIIYGTITPQYTFRRSFFNCLFGNFGSNITPFRAGHFPMMAYYQYKSGVPPQVTIIGFLKNQIIFSAVSIVVYGVFTVILAINGLTADISGRTVALWLVVLVGFAFHTGAFIFIAILAYNKKLQSGFLSLCGKIIKKFNKKFDYEKFIAEKEEKLSEIKEQFSIIGKNLKKFILPSILYAVYMFLSGSLQYTAYILVSKSAFSLDLWFTFYILNLASGYVGNVIPLPGAAGTSEVLFSLVFASVIPDSAMGATIVLWRASSFYFPILLEFVMFMAFSLKRKK